MVENIHYQIALAPFDQQLVQIQELEKKIFGQVNQRKWYKVREYSDVWAVLAYDQNELVGMKIGFAGSPSNFYSWLGGVEKEYRRQGIAQKLMELQHQECLKRGYKLVQTKTYNKWRGMLILNLKMGFNIVGTGKKGDGEVKILLEKKIGS